MIEFEHKWDDSSCYGDCYLQIQAVADGVIAKFHRVKFVGQVSELSHLDKSYAYKLAADWKRDYKNRWSGKFMSEYKDEVIERLERLEKEVMDLKDNQDKEYRINPSHEEIIEQYKRDFDSQVFDSAIADINVGIK